MLWVFSLAQLASAAEVEEEEEVSEEIFVYSDALAPWDKTRWWVVTESVSERNSLEVVTLTGSFAAPAWQLSAILYCEVVRRLDRGGIVECSPEDAAVRVATRDGWQREADREAVEEGLARLVGDLKRGKVRLRVRDHGDVVVSREQGDSEEEARLLSRAFDAFHLDLPDEGWYDGVQWTTTNEPLIRLRALDETFGLEVVVHYGNRYRGNMLIQTIGQARKSSVYGMKLVDENTRYSPEERFQAGWTKPTAPGLPKELTVESTLDLSATAILDQKLGFVSERVWVVRGSGAIPLYRSGRLKLLGKKEILELGETGQVSPPLKSRPGLPLWEPVEGSAP